MAEDRELEDEDGAEDQPESAPGAPRPTAEAPLFKRWVVACLVVAVVAAGGAAAWRISGQAKWPREAPKLDIRYEAAAVRLAAPQTVSPSEEYLAPDGDVVFVTQDELRAVNQAAALSATTARKLAKALAERDPERRVEGLFALINDVPATPDGDKQAIVLYRYITAGLAGTEAPSRDSTKTKLDRLIGCRFVGQRIPPCPDRPSEVPLWTLAAIAILALTAGLFGLGSAWLTRRRASKAEHAVADEEVGGEAEEGA